MKLHPPIPDIPPEDPYSNDLFNRKDFGDALSSLFTTVQENVVLAVNAPWGEGKTTFARMWIADLKKQGMSCIYFDAYEHDYSDDPFVSFCSEIISLADSAFADKSAIQGLKEDFKSKAKRIGSKLLCTGTRIGVKALTLGILGDSDIEALNSIKKDVADGSSNAVSLLVSKAFDDYELSKNNLVEFRTKLAALGRAVREEQKLPLLIIVDELDRCRPDFALSLIERIKHLFAADDVSFVLFANMSQLENYVKTIYGPEVDARSYLHKFFTISTDLPQNRKNAHENDYIKYFHRLSRHYGIDDRRDLDSVLPALFLYYGFSLREIEQCFTILSLHFAHLTEHSLSFNSMIAFLAVLRVRFLHVFRGIAAVKLSYDNVVDATGITRLNLRITHCSPRRCSLS